MQIPGIRHKMQLRGDGIARRTLARWLREGAVTSIQPWYVTPEAPQDVVALLHLGVRPTCLDGASAHGLWTPPHTGTHVYRPRVLTAGLELEDARAFRVRRRAGRAVPSGEAQPLVLHGPELRTWPDQDPVPDLGLLLEHAGRCLPVAKSSVLFESALNRELLGRRDVDRIVATLPQCVRRPLARVRSDAESGTETTVRWWFESRGVAVRSQVRFPDGRRRMDLLVGESWVIECDSREFHDDPRSYDEDRERDLHLTSWGYTVTRLSWEQVFRRWPQTERMLLAIYRRGEYRKRPRCGEGELVA